MECSAAGTVVNGQAPGGEASRQGTTSQAAEKTRVREKMREGTTLVVPNQALFVIAKT